MNEIEKDLQDYYKLMLANNTYGCILIEKKYGLYGASPEMVTIELEELARALRAEELIALATKSHVDICLHLPGYDEQELIMVCGAITTRERFEEFDTSLCHLFSDGNIKRYGCVIGTVSDIEVLNVADSGGEP